MCFWHPFGNINQHIHILENKQNNNNVKNGKRSAWAKMHTLYNASQTNGERTEEKLRKWWENLKQKQRVNTTTKRQSKIKMGGDEKEESDDDEETCKLYSIKCGKWNFACVWVCVCLF